MKNILLFILSLLVFGGIHAQQATIHGGLINDDTTPSEFANVLLYNAVDSTYQKGVITDFDGKFQFENIKIGSYFLTASQVGSATLHSALIDVTSSNQQVLVPVLIFESGLELEEVTVTAKKPLIELEAGKIVMNVANSSV